MHTASLAARSLKSVWHPCTPMKRHETEPLLAVQRAQGPWLYDTDGKRYLDAISSWWVNLFGHSHPHIRAALADQLEQLDHVMLAGCTHAPVVELSERLAALTGLGHASYGSDGASATEMALKMSAHYWRNLGRPEKNGFVGLAGGYHGETVGALSVTDVPVFRSAYAPLVRLSATVPSPDARLARPGDSAADVVRRAAAALQAWLEQHHARTAALVVEPLIQCAAGMVMYDPAYLRRARALCDHYQVHLVVDEIATGFGRTGSMFAHQQAGIRPDFICLSKGLTGGTLPLSAVLTTDAVYQAFYGTDAAQAFLHSHSYTGNPLACRAALATLELFEQLLVREGDRVEPGQLLARLEQTRFGASVGEVEARLFGLQAKIVRLRAEVTGEGRLVFPADLLARSGETARVEEALFRQRRQGIDEELRTLRVAVDLAQKEQRIVDQLYADGDASGSEVLRVQRGVNEAQARLANRRNKFLEDARIDLAKAEDDIAQGAQTLTRRKQEQSDSVFTAVVPGIVKNIRVTTVGGVLRAGEELMQIVPVDDELMVEAKVSPADISRVVPGLEATLRFDTFDYTIFGGVKGRVAYVSADSLKEETSRGVDTYYRVRIEPSSLPVTTTTGRTLEILPGMTAQVDIRTGERSLMDYLLKPLRKTMNESFGER